jgi:hypothetical protein
MALISLLLKKGDLAALKNWRPVSLINTDYKVWMAALASRLARHLGSIIGEEQCGFLQGRSIFNPILTAKALFKKHKRRRGGMALLLDLEKAYDRVNHSYLFRCLRQVGVPERWCEMLSSLYSYSSSKVMVNKFHTDSFRIGRGVRQGCPLSPLLFTIAIEPLAELIRADERLKGIKLGNRLIKVILYADDITVWV